MGAQVIAKCECGLREEILTGGNMRNYLKIDYYPFYCGDCNNVVQGNLRDNPPFCPNCNNNVIIPYSYSKLKAKSWKNIFYKYTNEDLTKGFYKCPKCQKMKLRFYHGDIFWD